MYHVEEDYVLRKPEGISGVWIKTFNSPNVSKHRVELELSDSGRCQGLTLRSCLQPCRTVASSTITQNSAQNTHEHITEDHYTCVLS
jgi:hypothetical protein